MPHPPPIDPQTLDVITAAVRRDGISSVALALGVDRGSLLSVLAGRSRVGTALVVAQRWAAIHAASKPPARRRRPSAS
jgi:hypothetical protein